MKITDSPGAMLLIPTSASAALGEAEASSTFQPAMLMALAGTLDLPTVLVPGGVTLLAEEAEDTGTQEIPEPHRHQEHHRPAVRERRARARLLLRPELQEAPRLDGQERQRDDLGGREERAERHVLRRLAGEGVVAHRRAGLRRESGPRPLGARTGRRAR